MLLWGSAFRRTITSQADHHKYDIHQSRRRSLTDANHRHNGYNARTMAIQTAYATHKSHPKPGGNEFAFPPIDGTGCNMNVNADEPYVNSASANAARCAAMKCNTK